MLLKTFVFLGFFLSFFSLYNGVDAATVESKSSFSVPEEKTITENVYVLSGSSFVEGKIDGDYSVVSAQKSVISGVVSDDSVLISPEVILEEDAVVSDDLKILAGDAVINGKVRGDLFVVGGSVFISDTAEISGDIVLIGGRVLIDGDLRNHTKVVAGQTSFIGDFKGIASVTTQRLHIGNEAKISGTINYFSPVQVHTESGAEVTGSVLYNYIKPVQDNSLVEQAVVSFLNFWILLRFVSTLILSLVLVFLFKVFTQEVVNRATNSILNSTFSGILIFFLLPIIAAILFISLILTSVSILIILSHLFFIFVATALSGIIAGVLIKRAYQYVFSKDEEGKIYKNEISSHVAIIGVIALTFVEFVPIFGEIVRFVFMLIALGAIWRFLYTKVRWGSVPLFNKK